MFRRLSLILALLSSAEAFAHNPSEDVTTLDTVTVYGRAHDLTGNASAASDGRVGAAELAARPFLRRGELIEAVPGVVITQHSGSGKANQYFLRGFNLDHGTDFSVSVDGLPVNMRTHGHGQGYADLNFIIPELVEGIEYQKGPYHARNGDFSAAGAAQFSLVNSLARNFVKIEGGEGNFARLVAAGSHRASDSSVTTAGFEASYYDGPWEMPENGRRLNGMLRQVWTTAERQIALTALVYRGEWDSTDQVPQRAIERGLIGRFGAVDPSDGGDSERASLSLNWHQHGASGETKLSLYGLRYQMDLFSNFTYFLDDPAEGDQFEQEDSREVFGGEISHSRAIEMGARSVELATGAQWRSDFIDVGLHRTAARKHLGTVRSDHVREHSAALFAETTIKVTDRLRMQPGIRADVYWFDVQSDQALNSGKADAALVSPKLNIVFAAGAGIEIYANAGYGFHSNDARGTTITVDPADGITPADKVDALARAVGAETGVRISSRKGLVSTLSVWALELDSELLFVGDGGATEPNGKTRRYGIEWSNFYHVNSWLALDADLSLTQARYAEDAGEAPNEGRYIPGSLSKVITAGAVVELPAGWSTSWRLRYFGPQPLIEDNSVKGPSTLTCNATIGWENQDWSVALSVLNVFDRANNDIVYYYESRLATEAAPVADRHIHPAEPRTGRIAVTRRF